MLPGYEATMIVVHRADVAVNASLTLPFEGIAAQYKF
jgi:hypothetical protein